ncbi:ABC transporter substrate-binding protein [soil metagenome]
MKKLLLGTAALALASLSLAQTFTWPAEYAPTAVQGGNVQETSIGDFTTFNPVLTSNATETVVLGMTSPPGLLYRDWLGTRTFKNEAGDWNLAWAESIDEVRPDQEYVVKVKEGWMWSDGTEMTVDDIMAARTIIGDPAVESNSFSCSVVDEDPVVYEKVDTYTVRITYPKPQVNAIASYCGEVPAHVFMPVYEQSGAEGIKSLWGIDTPVSEIVSGGPYMLSEFRSGERVVLTKNPTYGQFVQAADGSPLPGPDSWTVTVTEDRNAELALCTTGQCSFYYPTTLDEVRAVQQAVQNGSVDGELFANIGPGSYTDYLFYNFNNTDECKANMFKDERFRQAVNNMIDREALINAALGGLGVAGYDYNTAASAPFDASFLTPFEFNPDAGVALLADMGFTQKGSDGVLTNPETGCRAEFDLQYNDGNNRRAQEALVISQTAAPYGVKINSRAVSVEVWGDSWSGTELPRAHDFDAEIGALVGGDVDNPSGINVFTLASNLNGWNKDKTDAQAWEILMDRLTRNMDAELDLDKRVALYNQRAELQRQYLPLTPLISPQFHFFENMGNVWPLEELSSTSIQSPYRPGNFRENLTTQ